MLQSWAPELVSEGVPGAWPLSIAHPILKAETSELSSRQSEPRKWVEGPTVLEARSTVSFGTGE